MKLTKALLLYFFITLIANISLYAQQNNLSSQQKEALAKLNEILTIYLNSNKDLEAAETYSDIGFIYWKSGALRYATDNFVEGAKIFIALKKYKQAQTIYSNLGVIYTDLEEIELALQSFEKSLEVRRKGGNKTDIASGLIDVAYLLQLLNLYDDAIKYLQEALDLSIKLNNTSLIYTCYDMLAYNYKKIGNVKKFNVLPSKLYLKSPFLAEPIVAATHKFVLLICVPHLLMPIFFAILLLP